MKSNFAISTLLLCSTVIASPLALIPRGRRGKTTPVVYENNTVIEGAAEANTKYSSNWAGAVKVGSGVNMVSATATVPHVSAPGSGSQYGGSAWVGIDGDNTCTNAILQTGFEWVIENGQVSYNAWYEWLPEYSYNFDLAIRAGDQINMKVVATSKNSGTAYITNLTTGRWVSHTWTSESHSLCGIDAEWIVEDFSQNGADIPFANFGTVTFSDADYTASSSSSGINVMDIRKNNHVYTNCGLPEAGTVKCSYTG